MAKKTAKKSDGITKDMLIGEIVAKNPEAAAVMMEHGMHCIGCHVSAMETLAQGCEAHGLSDKDIADMVKKINSI